MDPLTKLSVKTATTPVPNQPPKRPLREIEGKVHQEGEAVLLLEASPTETKAIDPPKELRSSTGEEKAALDKTGEVAATAVESVKHEAKAATLPSIHQKWLPSIRGHLETEGIEDVATRILGAREKIGKDKEMLRGLKGPSPTPMEQDVREKLKDGRLKRVDGGCGGVYFLCNEKGRPEYVLKPGDEVNNGLNNGKKFASPYLEGDVEIPENDAGIHVYETPQNAVLAYQTATILGIEGATPQTEVMILEHQDFHDILDDIAEKEDPWIKGVEVAMPTTKEKVCTVQKFVEGCADIGRITLEKSEMTPEQLGNLTDEEQAKFIPADIDHSHYEAIAILSYVTGEVDGNSGSFMCPEKNPPEGKQRPLFKIDNAASFPDHNREITTGIEWSPHNFVKPISAEAKALIRNIDDDKIQQIKDQMKAYGKSDESIAALERRIKLLKEFGLKQDFTWADLDEAFLNFG